MVVNAGFDSMGGVTDGGPEISSAPSRQQFSDLEKTQAELRETFSAAEKFRRELEFLQKGGDPLDLKFGNVAPLSLQSTSLIDPHTEQIVTSEGAPSIGENNSADNLMLFDGDNKFHEGEKRSLHPRINNNNIITESDVALELPKKSYRRRIRSRPNRDVARSTSTDAGPRSGQLVISSTSKPKSPKSHKNLTSNNRLDVKLNGIKTHKSTFSPAYGQPLISDAQKVPVSMVKQETLGPTHPSASDTQTVRNQDLSRTNDCNNSGELFVKKGFESKSSCSQTDNENEPVACIRNINSNGTVEHDLAANEDQNDVNTVNDDKISDTGNNNNSDPCSSRHDENGSTLNEDKILKKSEDSVLEEQHKCSQGNVKRAIKEHEDSVLEQARSIQEKRNRIARLSVGIFSSDNNHGSHWHFVLQEMSWMANDFAQERLWKVTAAAHISRRAAYNSRVRFQQQTSLWKQKEVARALAGAVMEFWHTLQVKCDGLKLEGPKTDKLIGLHQYGMRFLEYNNNNISQAQYSSAQAPTTPDRISDLGIVDILWEDNLTEENLFYTVPSGAIEAYRKSIESHLLQSERTASSVQEEVDAAGYDAVAAIESQDHVFEEEGETSTYYLPGGRTSQPAQKKQKHFISHAQRSYETGPDISFTQYNERDNIAGQPSVLSGKRPVTNINVSIPTKRIRTASRPRFTGSSGYIHAGPDRAEASNGDTNSFQDDTNGGPHIANNTMEAESVGEYEKQLHFDLTEVLNRPKKKKKAKHPPGSVFENRWQLDSNFQNEQKDHSKRRLDTHQFDSNGNSVTSNMSNPNKFMKLLVRDRGRKAKSLKNEPGSGSPWSLFEDQALVVLVHDMGANWELISDAMNGTLQFKCISRNSKECKERHKILMDNNGDGADSAEDSGSSQPYPSTLPGIPEGSARQLFQRLQGPKEEETLKSHFEKIIMIWQKQHYRKAQKDNQDPKQLQQPHGSHALALSQVCPNNLNGGPVLTPLDLIDAISPSPDFVPIGYQGPHTSALPVPNNNVAAMVPGSNSMPGSSVKVVGSQLASASAPLSPSVREGRYGITRGGSLSIDEQHRMQQQFSQMSARNMQQQTSLPPVSNPGTDRGGRMLPGGPAMGIIGGINRGIPMARPGFQPISAPVLNSGVTSAIGPGQGNPVRPRETMRMMRPNQNMAPDQLPPHQQVSQGGMGGAFPNQNSQPHAAQSYPHPMSPHMPNNININSHPQNPAYGGIRFIKERQLHHQRMLQQQQFATSNPMMPPVQSQSQPQQSQLPVSSPVSSPPVSVSPSGSHGLVRKPQTGAHHTPKQKPRQPQQFQPPGRQQPPQHPANKVMKGGGRGKIHQNIPAGTSHPNGLSGSQIVAEKVDQQVAHQLVHRGKTVNSKQPMPHSSLSQSQQHKKFPVQMMANNSKDNYSELSRSKVQQAKEATQISEPFNLSGRISEDMVPSRSPPHSNSEGSGGDGPAVNFGGGGVHKQSEPDTLANSVQWQEQSSS